MNKNIGKVVACAILGVMSGFAHGVVKQPSIKPAWSGAKVATWTMDYKTALETAAANGKYTVMLFSGMWWCPYCQNIEENVLTTSEWKNFVKANGLYEVAMDYPSRTGSFRPEEGGRWCWLWDTAYRNTAKITAEEAAAEIAERLKFQGEVGKVLGSTSIRTGTNWVVEVTGTKRNAETNGVLYAEEPTTSYNEINYGNLTVFGPDGKIAGQVNISHAVYVDGKKVGQFYPEYEADPVGYVTRGILAVMYPDAGEPIVEDVQYTGSVYGGNDPTDALVGTVTCKKGKANKSTNQAAISFTFTVAGKKTTLKTNVYSAENVTAVAANASGAKVSFVLGADKIEGVFNDLPFCLYRDAIADGDDEALEMLDKMKGNWSLIVDQPAIDSGCEPCGTFVPGIATRLYLTVNFGSKGTVKVSGQTSDGTKVSVTTQLVLVGNDKIEIPIADSKKLGSAFVLVVERNGNAKIRNGASYEELVAFNRPAEALAEPLYFSCDDGTAVKLSVKGNKLTATGIGLSLSYAPKTGICKGSYTSATGKVAVYGVFSESIGYLNASPKTGLPANALISAKVPEGYKEDSEGDDCECIVW